MDPYDLFDDQSPEPPARPDPPSEHVPPGFAMRPPPERAAPAMAPPHMTVENNPAALRLGPAWLLMLFVRPDIYFQRFARGRGVVMMILVGLIVVLSGTSSRVETFLISNPDIFIPIIPLWTSFLICTLVGSVFFGALLVGLGGTWYWARLRMCGDHEAEWDQGLRVYLHAGLVHSIPHLLYTLYAVTQFDTPGDWALGPFDPLAMVVVGMTLWSAVVSFIGVRTVFNTKLVWSLLWFLVLPMVWVVLMLGLIFVGSLLSGADDPVLSTPRTHDAPGITFEYPGNWWIDTEHEAHDPQSYVWIDMWDDAWMNVMLYETESALQEEVEATVASYSFSTLGEFVFEREFTTLGPWTGYGEEYTLTLQTGPYTFTSFVADVGEGWVVEFVSLCREDILRTLQPGFDRVHESIRIDTDELPGSLRFQEF